MEKVKKIKQAPDFAGDSIGKTIMRFSVPCVLSLLVGALYNIVDQVFIGQGVGYLGHAATNVVCPVTIITLGLALWIGDGCASTYSLNAGKGEAENGHKIIGNGIIIGLIFAAFMMVVGFVFKKPILYLFGATDTIYSFCDDYMTYIMIGVPFYMLTNTLNPMIRADGSPRYALVTVLIGAIINVILDPIAIFVFNAGVKGAAIATVIGQAVSFALSAIYFIKPKSFKFSVDSFKINAKLVIRALSVGFTSFVTQLAIMIIMAVMNNILTKYGAVSKYGGEIPLSVVGIVMKVFQIVISIVIGISIGAQPFIGFNYGAGNFDRVKKAYKIILSWSVAVCLAATVLFEACPIAIVRIFGNESELYNEYAVKCFRIFLGSIALCGVTKCSSIFLQALGKPAKSMCISLMREILFMIPSAYILAACGTVGVDAVLWSAPISDTLCCIITIIVVIFEIKNMDKLKVDALQEHELSAA